MTHEELLNILEDHHQRTDDNVVAVGIGYKMTNDSLTEEKSVVFTVKKKLPKESLTPEQLLPSHITLPDNTTLRTDVVEGEIKALTCDPNFYTWQSTPPGNRGNIRPLQGGVSISVIPTNPSGAYSMGTMGSIVKDTDNNSLAGLSNNHVVCANGFIASERTNNSLIENLTTDVTIQSLDTGISNFINKAIGYPKRYYPLTSAGYNYIDAALTTINEGNDPYSNPYISNSVSYHQYGLTSSTYPFASTTEINNLMSTNPLLYSTGRTTGAKGEGITKLKLYQFPAVGSVAGYRNQHFSTTLDFSDLIEFVAVESSSTPVPPTGTVGLCAYPIYPGDSGSVLIADFSGTKKIIGLCFASSTYFAFACRIDRVVNLLDIDAWNGETLAYSDVPNISTHIEAGLSSSPYLDIDGKRYWQSGLITYNPTTTTTTSTGIPAFKLVTNNLSNLEAALGGSSTDVASWNTFLDLPTNGNVFTSVNVVGNNIYLYGASNIALASGAFVNIAPYLTEVDDQISCIISMSGSTFISGITIVSIKLPAVTTIGTYEFANCEALTTVHIPLVTVLKSNAFNGCLSLSSFDGSNITSLEDSCFIGCTSLTSIISFPLVSSLPAYTYQQCSGLTSVSSTTITSIDTWAFGQCPNITSVSLPNCTSIGDSSFYQCTSLTTLYLPSCTTIGSTTTEDDNIFTDITGNIITVTVPTASSTDEDIVLLMTNNPGSTLITV